MGETLEVFSENLYGSGLKTTHACPGRGAAFFMPLRRAGTVPNAGVRYGPGSAAHYAAKSVALRCVRATRDCLGRGMPPNSAPTKTNHLGRNMSDIAGAANLADMIRAQGKLRGY